MKLIDDRDVAVTGRSRPELRIAPERHGWCWEHSPWCELAEVVFWRGVGVGRAAREFERDSIPPKDIEPDP